jgi:L-histidine N-alpha-methyltransferase
MATANVTIHASQFPENVRRDLLASLATRRVNHKFHYDSVRQTQKWLALHQAHSPSRNNTDCADTYNRAFAEAVNQIVAKQIHVVGLGCGGGQKDTRLLELLKAPGREIFYTPCDVSIAMTLVARQTALAIVPEKNCFPFVCDLATANDLSAALATRHPSLVTFLGMIPNFEPEEILPKLAALVRPQDFLLFSANLAPGADYAAGMKKIFPQYDNALTRDWLMAFLLNLGVENGDGELRFTIETGAANLQRVMARFHFTRDCRLAVEADEFKFRSGESIQLFFSYRYTPELVQKNLARHGLTVCAQWLTKSAEEAVFLCQQV